MQRHIKKKEQSYFHLPCLRKTYLFSPTQNESLSWEEHLQQPLSNFETKNPNSTILQPVKFPCSSLSPSSLSTCEHVS